MFRLVEDYIRGAVAVAPPKDNYPFPLTDAVAGIAGTFYYFYEGKLKICANTNPPQVVIVEDVPAGTGVTARGYWVTPGMVYKASIIGNINAAFVPGLKAAKIAVDGGTGATVGMDGTAYADGKWTILRITADGKYAFVTPSESLFH